jgi:GTP-binding protein HflX
MYQTAKKEKALLVVIHSVDESWSREALAVEFKNLVLSSGIAVTELLLVNLRLPNPALYIGKGKAFELAEAVKAKGANVVIFSDNLNFTQQRNLEDILGVKTIDRTQLILDIFARHAHTQEGILQVEFAQLEYLLPRLRGKGVVLSRLGGGIGTRGPGEKKLEVDRRRISERIGRLKGELEQIKQHRSIMRKKREKEKVAACSLVGYTNAGKTTLFNTLTESRQVISASLFTTLDTVTRTITLDRNCRAVISDTVGFIYKLPPNLVDAFKATLEELNYADVLLHVIDSSSKDITKLKKSVDSTLRDLSLDKKPAINVFNKIDNLTSDELEYLKREYPEGVFISALRGTDLDNLRAAIYREIFKDMVEVVVEVPFNRMDIAHRFHDNFQILKNVYREGAAVYWLKVSIDKVHYLKNQGLKVKEV